MFQFDKEFSLARSTLTQAATIALSYFDKNPKSGIKADNSVVTEADEACEALIRKSLSSAFPTYGFLGEETEDDVRDLSWIVDPIDGTTSFSRGIPNFSMVIALKAEEDIVFSLVLVPLLELLYHAKQHEGAWKNDQPIRVSEVTDLKKGLIAIDRKSAQLEYSKEYVQKLLSTYQVRLGENAGTGSAFISQGSYDVLVKFHQYIWDTAPEYLLMKEAGAVVTDEFGDPLKLKFSKESFHNYIAVTPLIHKGFASEIYYPKLN